MVAQASNTVYSEAEAGRLQVQAKPKLLIKSVKSQLKTESRKWA